MDWKNFDNIVVLDACRYDFFERYRCFFNNLQQGELEKHYSNASDTPEFLDKNCRDLNNMSVVSANPFINSRGVSTEENYNGGIDYVASENFGEIVDLWASKWDEELNTVLPEKFLNLIEEDEGNNKYDLYWFIQPHSPFIGSLKFSGTPPVFNQNVPITDDIVKEANTLTDQEVSFLRIAYRFNLLRVLYVVDRLISKFDGKILITSDHGEVLGEGGVYGHASGSEKDPVREVPKMVIKGTDLEDTDNLSDVEFIRSYFKTVFNRPVDREALQNYSRQLRKGIINRRDFIEILIHSEEFKDKNFNPAEKDSL